MWRATAESDSVARLFGATLGDAADRNDRLLALFDVADIGCGQVLAHAGSSVDRAMFVVEGRARASWPSGRVASLSAGDIVGEAALLPGATADATVVATTPLRVLLVRAERFDELLADPGVARAVTVSLARRGREEVPAG